MPMSSFSAQALEPPRAPIIPRRLELHGDLRTDNYYWLRDYPQDPNVLKYLEAENAYTRQQMADVKPLQDKLYTEMRARMIEADQTVPFLKNGYYYYSRVEPGHNYRIYCRRQGSMQAPEQVLLDLNREAEGKAFLDIGVFEVSPDGRYLAYSVDHSGAESFTLHIRDLVSGQDLTEAIPHTYYTLEWAADSQHLFYTVIDDTNRPYRLYRHRVGTAAAADVLVHEETDERFNVEIYKTASENYLVLYLASLTTSECRYLPAENPTQAPVMVAARREGIEYRIQDSGSRFLIHTNDGALNFRLAEAPIQTPDIPHWKTFVAEQSATKLEQIRLFDNWAVLFYRTDARQEIRVQHLLTAKTWTLSLPERLFTVVPDGEQNYAANRLRIHYNSLLTPDTVFDVDLTTQALTLLKQKQVPGYEASRYVTERLYATAPDGVKVPVSLIYRRGLKKNGQNPTLLYSYGAYGASTDTDFDADRLALLDRGFVFALAHIRGGEDMGRQWYLDGKLLNKRNSFTDFIASAEALIQQGFTAPTRLVIEGGSAGGLLMGAVTNLRPDLFQGVVADVPFVDAITTMLDPDLPLTVIEYDEWGNPNQKEAYDYIKSYSPYDNITARAYPNMLVLAGLNDPRVKYWEPAKYVARLRALKTDQNLLLLRTHLNAGHSGSSGRYSYLEEVAFKYAFFLKVLGVGE